MNPDDVEVIIESVDRLDPDQTPEQIGARFELDYARALGSSPRAPGWLGRKLVREYLRPELSLRARVGARSIGFFWLGTPPSLPGTVRAGGMAVEPQYRRQGVASRLVEEAAARVEGLSHHRLRCLSEPPLVDWYTARGFRPIRELVTLRAMGTGTSPPLPQCEDLAPSSYLFGWLPEVWASTPRSQRACLPLPALGLRAFVTDEADSLLVHGLAAAPPALPSPTVRVPVPRVIAAMDAVVRQAKPGRMVFVYGAPEPIWSAGGLSEPGREVGWSTAQRFWVVERFTSHSPT